jgi:hypothetical protein
LTPTAELRAGSAVALFGMGDPARLPVPAPGGSLTASHSVSSPEEGTSWSLSTAVPVGAGMPGVVSAVRAMRAEAADRLGSAVNAAGERLASEQPSSS